MFDSITLNGEYFHGQQLRDHVLAKQKDLSLPGWEKEVYAFIHELMDENEYITAFSSGTTGEPKPIKLFKQELIDSAKRTEQYFQLNPGDHALLCLPAKYIAGKMMIVRAMVTGLNLWLSPPSSSPLQNITQPMDFVAMTPHQLNQSIANLKQENPAFKKIIIGGAPVQWRLMEEIYKLPCQVFETYGMTETCSHIGIKTLNGKQATDWFQLLEGFEISVDERNCLSIHFKNFNRESIQTNDIVDIEGRFFQWLGRYDNIINSGGIKQSPESIEQKLTQFLQFPFAISAKNDNKLGEKLILVIEMAKPNKTELVTINNLLVDKLSHLERPKEVAFLNSFPRTDSGKLKRKELRNLLNQPSNVYFVTLNK